MKTRLSTLFLLLSVALTYAVNPVRVNRNCGDYHAGTITMKNGKTKAAFIYLDDCSPEEFQSEVKFIDEKTYEKYKKGKKIKKSVENLKVKEVQGFTLEDGRTFRSVKYVDIFADTKLGMLPKRLLLEVVVDGTVTIYKKKYRAQSGRVLDVVSMASRGEQADFVAFMNSNFEVLCQKDKSKNPRNIKGSNLKQLFGDNQEVMDKYTNKEYAFYDEFQKESAFGVNCTNEYLEALLVMVNDYNGVTGTDYTSIEVENK